MKQIIVIIGILCLSYNQAKHVSSGETLIKKTYNHWNQKTIGSIKDQIIKTNNARIKEMLISDLEAEKVVLYDSTRKEKGMKGTEEPLRLKFLRAISADAKHLKNYFIVENVVGDEAIRDINYLIENKANKSHVISYQYLWNNWQKRKDTTITKVDLRSEMLNAVKRNNETISGTNDAWVTLSEFNSSNIKSHYYLPFSINSDDEISKIIKL
jgi:hypothetical protein